MEVTAELSPDDINEIIQSYLEAKGYTVSEIKPIVKTRTVGQMMNEHTEPYFAGINAKIKVKPIDRSEKDIVWDNR